MGKGKNIVLIIIFLCIVYSIFFVTLSDSYMEMYEVVTIDEDVDVKVKLKNIEELYKSKVAGRDEFIDLYGAVQMLMKKKVIGDFEFYKDNNGYMQMPIYISGEDVFVNEMIELKSVLDKNKIPLLYVQVPSRLIKGYTEIPEAITNNENQIMDHWVHELKKGGVETLDYREYIKEKCDNVFLKSDIHLTTETEWNILKEVITKLEEFGMEFAEKTYLLSKNNYKVDSRLFWGNLAASSGQWFSEPSNFNMYLPKFDTQFQMKDVNGNVVRTGKFEEVLMNKYQNSSEEKYWVTNYMQFMSAKHSYSNEKQSNGKILIVMDSMGYRMASYLALLCKELVVIDPRFDNGNGYLQQTLRDDNYDAVIVLQENSLTGHELIIGE